MAIIHAATRRSCAGNVSIGASQGVPLWHSRVPAGDVTCELYCSLSDVQKLNYLRAQLQGDAARVIAGLPLTKDNYDDAMQLLSERYGQPHKIEEERIKPLSEIGSPSNTLSSLQLFYDTIQAHLRGLAALGKTKESFKTMLIPAILSKPPV